MRNNYPLTAITLESDCAAHHFIAFSVFSVFSVLLNLNSAAPSALQSTAGIKNLSKPQRQLLHAQPTAATNGSSLPRFFRKSEGGFPHLFKQTR